MRIHRPTVFWIFVTAFFIAVFSVLFYTYGFRFSFERGIFVYTGSLTINSNPDEITVRIDGEEVSDKRLQILNKSAHIGGLAPGEYQVEVTAPGFQTWQKKVIIESGRSTEFWNVLLSKENPEIITFTDTADVFRAFPSPEQDIIALAKKNGEELIIVTYNTETEVSTRVFSLANANLLDIQSDGIEWSPEAEKILVPVDNQGKREYYIVDVETTTSTKLPFSPEDTRRKFTRWHPREQATLLYLEKQTLTRLDTTAIEPLAEVMYPNTLSYDISSGQAYTLTANGLIVRYPLESSNFPQEKGSQITTSPIPVNDRNEYFVVFYDESRISLLEPLSGTFWLFNKELSSEIKELARGVRGTQFSDDGKKLLFYSDNDISVAFLRDWEVQPTRETGITQQIVRLSTPITAVQWVKDYEHALYAVGGNLQFAELDHRDYRNILSLTKLNTPPLQVFSRFDQDRIFIIRNSADSENRLIAIDFPEAENLFGIGN